MSTFLLFFSPSCRSIVITAAVFGAIGVVLPDSDVGGAAADSINPIRMVKNFFVGGGSGMAFHIIFMLFFMWKKKSDLAKEASKNYGETTLTADGKNVIYARKMTLCQKLFAMTVGLLISIVDLILSVLAFVGIDLKVCFFLSSFLQLLEVKASRQQHARERGKDEAQCDVLRCILPLAQDPAQQPLDLRLLRQALQQARI